MEKDSGVCEKESVYKNIFRLGIAHLSFGDERGGCRGGKFLKWAPGGKEAEFGLLACSIALIRFCLFGEAFDMCSGDLSVKIVDTEKILTVTAKLHKESSRSCKNIGEKS